MIYHKLQYLRNQDSSSTGLTHLRIPKNVPITDTETIKSLLQSNEHWENITVPQHIENILLQRNRHHFGQAKDTPFAKPPPSDGRRIRSRWVFSGANITREGSLVFVFVARSSAALDQTPPKAEHNNYGRHDNTKPDRRKVEKVEGGNHNIAVRPSSRPLSLHVEAPYDGRRRQSSG